MTFFEDARKAVPSAARLYRFDAGGMSGFDLSFEGFIRSFLVLGPVAVVYILLSQIEFDHIINLGMVEPPEPIAFFGWKMAGLIVDWFTFPLLMIPLSRWMGLSARYVPLIVALNWMSLIAILLWAIPAFLYGLGLVGEAPAGLLSIGVFVYVVAVTGFIIRTALLTPPAPAVGLTVLYLAIGIVIGEGIDRLIGI
ncbi:MAG: hypothetical protein KDJ77_19140 [Rhodobiaceae bacterium]|nr:hypothetical protein [Rhodobiaceae bacterium]